MVHRAHGRDDELRRRGEAPDVHRDLLGDLSFLPRRVEPQGARDRGAGCDRHDQARGRGRRGRGSREPRDRGCRRARVARRRAGRGCSARARPRARRRGPAGRRGRRPAGLAGRARAVRPGRASLLPAARGRRGGAPAGHGRVRQVHAASKRCSHSGGPAAVGEALDALGAARGPCDVGARVDMARVGHRRRRGQALPGGRCSVDHRGRRGANAAGAARDPRRGLTP